MDDKSKRQKPKTVQYYSYRDIYHNDHDETLFEVIFLIIFLTVVMCSAVIYMLVKKVLEPFVQIDKDLKDPANA